MSETTNPVPTNNTVIPKPPSGELSLHLTIRNRKAIIFEDNVKAMSSLNDKGKFDILPHHGNFISLIKEYITIHKIDGSKQTIQIQNGIIYVRKNEASCYVDLLSTPTEAQITQQKT